MKTAATLGALLAGALLAPQVARSAEPTPVDPDFLEFLGSIDSEGDGWGEYLGTVDLGRTPPPQPAPPARKSEPVPPAKATVKEPEKGAGK